MTDFWNDPRVLADGDRSVRRIIPNDVYAHAPQEPLTHTPAIPDRDPLVARTLRALPEAPDGTPALTWQEIIPDPVGRAVLKALFDSGFEYTGDVVDNRAYLARGRDTIILTVDMEDSLRITHLTHGNVTIPARHAAGYVLELGS